MSEHTGRRTGPSGRKLREAHAHIAQHGRATSMLRLDNCASREACLERVSAAADAATGEGWILGAGLRVEAWADPRWPTAEELDKASRGRPCCLWSFDHHALVANTAAMRAAGISAASEDPPNGRIVRAGGREGRGKPTGLMLEGAAKVVWSAAPEPGPEERRAQVMAALADFRRCGFDEVHDLHAPLWLGPALAEIERAGELDMTVLLYAPLAEIERAAEGRAAWESDRVRLAGAKLFADGTLNSRTAWMLSPYADPLEGMPRGQVMATPPEVEAALQRVARLGLGLAVHAIGDGAVRAVLDGYELFLRGDAPSHGAKAAHGPMLRIEHAELIDEADVPRFAAMGVVASVQPCHLLTDIEVLRRVLPHRLERVLPLRELIDGGCRPGELLWFGSDAPIVRPEPEDSIQAAVHRRRTGMEERDGIALAQAISEAEAWACFNRPAGAPGS